MINRAVIPGTFTMGNIVCGFLAILSAFNGEIVDACWLIVLAGFLDALDGKVARISGGASQFGVELDSLADFLSFGVAPAVLVHTIILNYLGKLGWVISIVYIMAASYRLARYNLLADTDEKKDFLGLPVPMAALPLVTYIIFSYKIWGSLQYSEILITMVILFAFLMVSQVNYDAFPDKFETPQAKRKLGLLLISAIIIVIKPRLLLFPFFALYILYGITHQVYVLLYTGVGKISNNDNERRKSDKRLDNE